ncbi:hypothetical protein P691DRAFT_782892 [Macrolepiota fuliginosa MF-IS2]|uniref:Uncharacterized protein n=1 Tax=Macrolepiota fuliginosa MF-IS2 TaxID=1400762 RepID=A0A9P6BV37_9AGAR|nr:hypothetical protein P691DRAFT_782892 [Macrolepiota fuliginosa MF-IS2]
MFTIAWLYTVVYPDMQPMLGFWNWLVTIDHTLGESGCHSGVVGHFAWDAAHISQSYWLSRSVPGCIQWLFGRHARAYISTELMASTYDKALKRKDYSRNVDKDKDKGVGEEKIIKNKLAKNMLKDGDKAEIGAKGLVFWVGRRLIVAVGNSYLMVHVWVIPVTYHVEFILPVKDLNDQGILDHIMHDTEAEAQKDQAAVVTMGEALAQAIDSGVGVYGVVNDEDGDRTDDTAAKELRNSYLKAFYWASARSFRSRCHSQDGAGWAGLCITSVMAFTPSVCWICQFRTAFELELVYKVLLNMLSKSNNLGRGLQIIVHAYSLDLPQELQLKAGQHIGLLGQMGSNKPTPTVQGLQLAGLIHDNYSCQICWDYGWIQSGLFGLIRQMKLMGYSKMMEYQQGLNKQPQDKDIDG